MSFFCLSVTCVFFYFCLSSAEETLDIDSRLFLQFCQSQDQLLRTYSLLDKINCTCQPPKEIEFLEQVGILAFP